MEKPQENLIYPTTNHRLVTLAALIVIAAGIKLAEELVVPFVLSIFIATIAATPVFWLNRFKIPVAILYCAREVVQLLADVPLRVHGLPLLADPRRQHLPQGGHDLQIVSDDMRAQEGHLLPTGAGGDNGIDHE